MRMNLIKNKRGSVFDIFIIIIVLAGLGVCLLFGNMLTHTINNQLSTQINNTQVNTTLTSVNAAMDTTDLFFLFIFAGLIAAMFISAFLIEVNPVFAPIFLILIFISVLVAIPISNFYEQLSTSPALAATAAKYPIQNLIFSQLPMIVFIIGIVAAITSYAKSALWGGGAGRQ